MIKRFTGMFLMLAVIAQPIQARTKEQLYEEARSFAESMKVFEEAIDPSNMDEFRLLNTKLDGFLRTLTAAGYDNSSGQAEQRNEVKLRELDQEFTRLKTSRPSSQSSSRATTPPTRSTSPKKTAPAKSSEKERTFITAEIAKIRTAIKQKWGSAGCPLVEGSLRTIEIRLNQTSVITKEIYADMIDTLSDAKKNMTNDLICRD